MSLAGNIFTHRDIPQRPVTDPVTNQSQRRQANVCRHAPHLAIPAFSDHQIQPAGWDVPEPLPSNISIIPRTCSLKNAQQTLKEAKILGKLSPKIVIVLHHDDFEEYCNADNSPDHPSFTNLSKLELLLQVISDDSEIEIKSLNQITETPDDCIQAIKNNAWFLKQNWRLRKHLPCNMLLRYPLPIILVELLKGMLNRYFFSKET